jgi:hypothetical protein
MWIIFQNNEYNFTQYLSINMSKNITSSTDYIKCISPNYKKLHTNNKWFLYVFHSMHSHHLTFQPPEIYSKWKKMKVISQQLS